MIGVKTTNAFTFKQFTIKQDICTMKVNTDGVLLGAWASVNDDEDILDIGTGTGLIALMIAQRAIGSQIIGIDIDENSIIEANENIENSIFKNQVSIKQISIQEFADIEKNTFDHIVSNPPFFTGGTFSANENKASVRHTIKMPHSDLIHAVNLLLKPEGKFSLILPFTEGLKFQDLAERSGLNLIKKTAVKHHESKPIERLLLCFARKKMPLEENQICITQGEMKEYSKEFIALTKNFYQNF